MWQLAASSLQYPALNVFPFHFKVYFGSVSTFWARYLLGNLCFQRCGGASRGVSALMSKRLGACLERPWGWPQWPSPYRRLSVWGQMWAGFAQGIGAEGFVCCVRTQPGREGESPKTRLENSDEFRNIFLPLGGRSLEESSPWALTLVCQMWFSRLLER